MNNRCQARTEVYSRVVGFFRPVQEWNKGKQEEFGDRSPYDIKNKEGVSENEKRKNI